MHAADHARLVLEIQGYVDNSVLHTQQRTRVLFNWLTSHVVLSDRPAVHHILQLRAKGGEASIGTEPAGTS
jgi:hypothetical protein